MKERDYHAKILVYGLNKDVSVQHIVEWLRKEADWLENNNNLVDETLFKATLKK
jgi:hypothetical protein